MDPTSKLRNAAFESYQAIEGCYRVFGLLKVPPTIRNRLGIALAYGSLDQARTATFLLAHDLEGSLFGALVLLRSQLEHLMRSGFFMGPATDAQLQHFLDKDSMPRQEGQLLGPISLSKINAEFYDWKPRDRLPLVVEDNWKSLTSMSHGGHALLNYYIHGNDVSRMEPTEDFIEVLSNVVALTHLAISMTMRMATNQQSDELQEALATWHDASKVYFAKWGPSKTSIDAMHDRGADEP